jgi:AcrR family transcriptional regulator
MRASNERGGEVGDELSTLRDRKKARVRATIIEAATALFARQGYDDTTVEEVAAAAEVSPATIFRYFGSKEDLIYSYAGVADSIPDAMAACPEGTPDLEVGRAVLGTILGSSNFNVERLKVLSQALQKSAVVRGRGSDIAELWVDGIAAGLAKRHGASPADPAIRLRARVLMVGLELAFTELVADQHADVTAALGSVFGRLAQLVDEWAGGAEWVG